MATRAHLAQRPCLPGDPAALKAGCHPSRQLDDERQCLDRVIAQEAQAFDTLYTRYAPRVRGYLAGRLRAPDLIDDVLQDVMLVLWQRAAQIPPTVPLIAWLCGVARHKAHKAVARTSMPAVSSTTPETMDHDEPETMLLRKELGCRLARALDTLPRCERTALELLVYQGCSYQEIAALTGEAVSTIRTRVSRARQRLLARAATRDSDVSSPA